MCNLCKQESTPSIGEDRYLAGEAETGTGTNATTMLEVVVPEDPQVVAAVNMEESWGPGGNVSMPASASLPVDDDDDDDSTGSFSVTAGRTCAIAVLGCRPRTEFFEAVDFVHHPAPIGV